MQTTRAWRIGSHPTEDGRAENVGQRQRCQDRAPLTPRVARGSTRDEGRSGLTLPRLGSVRGSCEAAADRLVPWPTIVCGLRRFVRFTVLDESVRALEVRRTEYLRTTALKRRFGRPRARIAA